MQPTRGPERRGQAAGKNRFQQKREQQADQHWRRGVKLLEMRDFEAASTEFTRATDLAPGDWLYWLNLAKALSKCGKATPAIDAATRAHALAPEEPIAAKILAECLAGSNRFADAASALEQLKDESQHDGDYWSTLARSQLRSRQPDKAVKSYMQAISRRMGDGVLHYELGLAFSEMMMPVEAAECYRTAAMVGAGTFQAVALAKRVYETRKAAKWATLVEDESAAIAALRAAPEDGSVLSAPFIFAAMPCTRQDLLKSGRMESVALRANCGRPWQAPLPDTRGRRIRVGYLSSDFFDHATARLMIEMLECRDTDGFEVTLYSHSMDDASPMRKRLEAACERFVEIGPMSDAETAEAIRTDGIDILVDLKGYTRDSRLGVFGRRAAPIQVSWLGFPATLGSDVIDYVIGDPIVTPLEHGPDYSEKIAQMPVCYQPNDRQRARPDASSRADCGLPEDAVVMAAFNQSYKVSPPVLDRWCAILRRAPGTVLWLLQWTPSAMDHLRSELAARGIDESQVVFAPLLPLDKHLARLRCADLFLDTWPYNAHTTASEALWAGVPVVTRIGETFASRVAASLLHAAGLGNALVGDSDQAFEDIAVALACDPARRRALRAHLDDNHLALPLFDGERFARDIEGLYRRMVTRAEQGLGPAALGAVRAE